jgi:hypothetical protein
MLSVSMVPEYAAIYTDTSTMTKVSLLVDLCCIPTLVQLLSLCLYNLLKWRPFFLDVAVQAFLGPIGVVLVLGADVGCRAPRWFSAGSDVEDEGLVGVSVNLCSVSFCK